MTQHKITREVPWTRPSVSLTSFTGGAGSAPSGQVPTSIGSNGQVAWGSNVALITVNGTTLVQGPFVNFANGSNTTVTVDQVGSIGSNTIRIHATGGAASFGSNSNQVSYANAPGASTDSSRADHVHLGVTSVSHSSNTYSGPVILAPGTNVGITSPTAGTFTIHSSASGGGSSGVTVQDEGTPLATTGTTLNFVGSGVTASGTGSTKTITISGGGSSSDHEASASVLTNATSTGDAGSRADHFPGTSLDAAWASEATALSAGPTVKYSVLSAIGPSGNPHHRLRPYTPSGAFRVEGRYTMVNESGKGVGLLVRDSGTGDASGNGFLCWYDSSSNIFNAYSLDTGTYTVRGSSFPTTAFQTRWIYAAIERDGSNNWTVQVSIDRVTWITLVSGHSKTFTVAKAGFRVFDTCRFAIDFFDVVS